VLPEGFSSRIVAVGGTGVGATDYTWPLFPDGKGTVATPDGGWILACNHEVFDFQTIGESAGGASSIRFDSGGSILDAYPILEGSHSNSRGATTPWGTWLSCQEAHQGDGRIWECDPTGDSPAVPRNALGVRTHGSVAVDPLGGHCYMTEAHRDGRLYRFRMLDESASGAALADGPLEAMAVDPDGGVSWIPVPDPSGTVAPTRVQAADGFVTPVGGGVWVHDGSLLFTTALDDRVHAVDLANQRHWILWDGSGHRQPLVGIGDLTVAPASGDLFVAEDRGRHGAGTDRHRGPRGPVLPDGGRRPPALGRYRPMLRSVRNPPLHQLVAWPGRGPGA
jgi:Predicted phosphatase